MTFPTETLWVMDGELVVVSTTGDQRTAMTFPALDVAFDWSNEAWALTFAPPIRMAMFALQKDDKELERAIAALIRRGVVPGMLDGWGDAKQHFKDLAKLLDTALSRSFVVLERLGYDPENPPPDTHVH